MLCAELGPHWNQCDLAAALLALHEAVFSQRLFTLAGLPNTPLVAEAAADAWLRDAAQISPLVLESALLLQSEPGRPQTGPSSTCCQMTWPVEKHNSSSTQHVIIAVAGATRALQQQGGSSKQ